MTAARWGAGWGVRRSRTLRPSIPTMVSNPIWTALLMRAAFAELSERLKASRREAA